MLILESKGDSLEEMMIKKITPMVAENIDLKNLKNAKEFLMELIRDESPSILVKNIFGKKVKITQAHKEFKNVLKHIQTLEPIFLTGPAGSGKSTIAAQAAESLQLNFASISVCAQTTKSDFLGYMNALGDYCPTLFRGIYENGGIFLIDEIDAGNPNVLAVLNAALSGDRFAFPDKIVEKHHKFLLVATANTLGKGSTEYVGRNQLDAATLDRFNFLHIDYDPKLESLLVPEKYKEQLDIFKKLRALFIKDNIRIIASTRSLIKIIKLLEADFDFKDALEATIFKGADAVQCETIFNKIGLV